MNYSYHTYTCKQRQKFNKPENLVLMNTVQKTHDPVTSSFMNEYTDTGKHFQNKQGLHSKSQEKRLYDETGGGRELSQKERRNRMSL